MFSESKFSLSLSVIIVTLLREKEFLMEEMKSLFLTVPKGKNLLQQEESTRDHLSLGDYCSQCD